MTRFALSRTEAAAMRVYPDRAVIDEVFTEVLWVTGNRYTFLPYADVEYEYEDGYANPVYVDEGINYDRCCGLSGPCPSGERECVPFNGLPGEVQRDILRMDLNWWDHDQQQGFTVAQRDQVIENIVAGKMPNRWLEGVEVQEARTDKRLTKPEKKAEVLEFPRQTGKRDRGIER